MLKLIQLLIFGTICFLLGRLSARLDHNRIFDQTMPEEMETRTAKPGNESLSVDERTWKQVDQPTSGHHLRGKGEGEDQQQIQNTEKEVKSPPLLRDILKRERSDKFSIHRYHHYYDKWFLPFRDTNLTFLEIGVLNGASMRTWQEYFRHHHRIYGLGLGIRYTVRREFSNGSAQVLVGDQSLNETMKLLWDKGPFDIILDDGSHYPQHMMFTFFSLWRAIKPGGLYIIEDLETNYWGDGNDIYGYILNGTGWGRNSPNTNAVDKLKQFIDILPRNQLMRNGLSIMNGDNLICSMEWGKNLVKIRKCDQDEEKIQPITSPNMKPEITSKTCDLWLTEAKKSNPGTFHDE